MPVLTLVLYLRPRQSALPQAYTVTLGKQVVNRFSYPVLHLWDYVAEIRSGKYRELVPVLLLLAPEDKAQVLAEERDLIMAEPDVQKRNDLLALAATIATQHFDSRYLWQFFTEQEVEQMQGAEFLEELLADKLNEKLAVGHAQGLKEGWQQGRQQSVRRINLDILTARFNPPATQYRQIEQQLEQIMDVEQLRKLLLLLVQTEDLAIFEQALAQAIPTT